MATPGRVRTTSRLIQWIHPRIRPTDPTCPADAAHPNHDNRLSVIVPAGSRVDVHLPGAIGLLATAPGACAGSRFRLDVAVGT